MFICGLTTITSPVAAQDIEFDRQAVYEEVCSLVQEHFFSEQALGPSWTQAREAMRARALQAATHEEFAAVMQELLRTLRTSHTNYFAATDPRRAQMLGIFQMLVPPDEQALCTYDQIGVDVEQLEGKFFIRSVYEGTPADAAGLLYGDEIVAVDGRPYRAIESFRGKQAVTVAIRRERGGPLVEHTITVRQFDGRTMFEDALRASARILDRPNGQRIGYVHVWSYAGAKYQELLRELLLFGDLRTADALVLDLRDGWGGASLEYLNLFREPIAMLTSRPRAGEPLNFSGVWGKPVALLVNRRSTSGKELFTYGFKKLGLGQVVGETTAGAVVAGRGFLLSNRDVLYLATSDVEVDGRRLEGVGVAPDIAVDRPLPYAAGADPQLERALEVLANRRRAN